MTSENRSHTALLIGLALLIGMVIVSIWLADQQKQSFALVRQALDVENRLSLVLSDFQDAEDHQRGYLLTGKNDYLGPIEALIRHADQQVQALKAEVADNPGQQAQV